MTTHTIFLIRHGTTEWMEQGIVHGSLDSPLSEQGRKEAQQTAAALQSLNITRIFSSPQGRALETAGIIAQKLGGIPITQLDNLREMDLGSKEGKKDIYSKVKRHPLLAFILLPVWFIAFGISGEKQSLLKQRIMKAWTDILSEKTDGNAAVVSHGIALNALTTKLPYDTQVRKKKRQNFKPCSITTVSIDEHQQAAIKDINNTKHIEAEHNHDH